MDNNAVAAFLCPDSVLRSFAHLMSCYYPACTQELLERISDGVLTDDRRSAMSDLRIKVAENPKAQVCSQDCSETV